MNVFYFTDYRGESFCLDEARWKKSAMLVELVKQSFNNSKENPIQVVENCGIVLLLNEKYLHWERTRLARSNREYATVAYRMQFPQEFCEALDKHDETPTSGPMEKFVTKKRKL